MKIVRLFFITFVLLFLVWTVGLYTPWAHDYARKLITEKFHQATGWNIKIGKISLLPSLQITAKDIVLTDDDSTVKIKSFETGFSPIELYHGDIGITSLFLEGVRADLNSKLFSTTGDLLLVNDLPTTIHIHHFECKDFKLKIDHHPSTHTALDFGGEVILNPKQHQIQLKMHDKDNNLRLVLHQKNDAYAGNFEIAALDGEIEGGIDISSDGSLSFQNLKGGFGSAVVEGHLALTPSFFIKNSGFQISLPDLHEFGDLTGNAILTGSLFSPDIGIKIQSPKVNLFDQTFTDFLVDVTARYDNSDLTGQASLSLVKDKHFMTYSTEFHWMEKDKKRTGRLSFSTNIHALLDLFDWDTPTLGGKINVYLTLQNLPDGQKLQTQIELTDGHYENLELGTLIHDIGAKVEITPNSLILKDLHGTDGKEGTVTGTGTVQMLPEKQYPVQFNFDLNHFNITQLDYLKASTTGNLSLDGNLTGATLSGTQTVDSAKFTLQQQTPELTETVDITYINIPEGDQAPLLPTPTTSKWPLKLDLQINAADHINVRGEGLESKWTGEVKIQGMADAPKCFGELNLTKGSYLFQGKYFELIQGSVLFDGDIRKKTTLHVISEIKINDRNIEVIVLGPASDPGIRFRSNPPMSQREILSWLIFGQGVSDLTPFQGSQLNQSITSLKAAAKSGGSDPLTKFRDSVGIDRIDISKSQSNDTEGVTLKLGKYISKGTYLSLTKKSVTQDTKSFTQGTSFGIETELMRNVKLQAEVGDDNTGQLNLLYKRDY